MARKPKAVKDSSNADSLIKALAFAADAFKAFDDENALLHEKHVVLHNKQMFAFNGVIAVGCAIDYDISCAPAGSLLRAAINKCSGVVSLSLAPQHLMIKAGAFSAKVPTVSLHDLAPLVPDAPILRIDDSMLAAFAMLGPLVKDTAQRTLECCICLESEIASATNGYCIVQYRHGHVMPEGKLLLPKAAAKALARVHKPLAYMGCGQGTATFWFDDQSWMRTQLYQEAYPDVNAVFSRATQEWSAIPSKFIEALDAVQPFTDEDAALVYITEDGVRSHYSTEIGANFAIKDMPAVLDTCLASVLLKPFIINAKWMDLTKEPGCYFAGDNFRAMVARSRYGN